MDELRGSFTKNSMKLLMLNLFFILGTTSVSAATVMSDVSTQPSLIMNEDYALNSFVYNPRTLQWSALQNGRVVRTGHGSGGNNYCRDIRRSCRTPTGVYHIVSKGGAGCRSSRYPVGRGGAPMPYCMFFSKLYAIHGSPDVPNYNASHGCIRVRPSDARWLSQNFLQVGSPVIVKSY